MPLFTTPTSRSILHPPQSIATPQWCRAVEYVVFALFLLLLVQSPSLSQIYISPTGSDTSSGTILQPFLTLSKAHSVAVAGDTIYARGGTYVISATMTLSKTGTANARFHLRAYPGERPLFDCSSMAFSSSNRGLRVSGSYWYIYGIDIKGAGDNGMNMSGSNNIVEWCSFFENRDSGLQLDNGASNNHIINCDSYFNADPTFENADGFAPKLTVGQGNTFTGCRSWQNADDGWDGYLRGADSIYTILENCWSFKNGYSKDNVATLPNGDGNGFKTGGSDDQTLRHHMTLVRCLAFDNRVKGFDQNNNRGSMTVINGTSFRNGTNYSFPGPVSGGNTITLTNCFALGPLGNVAASAVLTTNSWMSPFSADTNDVQSIDTSGMRGPRGPDGSLPYVPFLRLAFGSDLVNTGTYAGYPFIGGAPEIGAFESDPALAVPEVVSIPHSFVVHQNFPNPFNPSTTIAYELPNGGTLTLSIFDVTGRRLFALDRQHETAGSYTTQWSGTSYSGQPVASGVYFASLAFNGQTKTLKLFLVK